MKYSCWLLSDTILIHIKCGPIFYLTLHFVACPANITKILCYAHIIMYEDKIRIFRARDNFLPPPPPPPMANLILYLGMEDNALLQKAKRLQLDFLLVLIDGEVTQINGKCRSKLWRDCIHLVNIQHMLHSTKMNTPDKSIVYSWFAYLKKTPKTKTQTRAKEENIKFFLIHSKVKENPEQVTELQPAFAKFLWQINSDKQKCCHLG